jgi:ketosteroid isomerase-like protein
MTSTAPLTSFLTRLVDATNSHDVERVVDCFAPDYVNSTPLHPARGFRGREQVGRNWARIFGAVPDVTARVVATAAGAGEIWSEWEMSGHRRDGVEHLMRGVIVFEVDDTLRARAARFYLEPVNDDGQDADGAVRQVLAEPTP